jgi:hypothetical protein
MKDVGRVLSFLSRDQGHAPEAEEPATRTKTEGGDGFVTGGRPWVGS